MKLNIMKLIDNINSTLKDDLCRTIKAGSRVSIAAACFSMYAYRELKKQLEEAGELRFIFTSPAFTAEKTPKQKREFYIPRRDRESSLYGTEFEIKLRNEMTQKAIAKECAEWISKKAKFKANISGASMQKFLTVESQEEQTAYMPVNGFTTVDLGCERGNNFSYYITGFEAPYACEYIKLFDSMWNDGEKLEDVTAEVIESISSVYNENSPEFIYFMTLYHVFSEFLEDVSQDELPNEATGFKSSKIWNMLYKFQYDAALAIINKLERYNGCILADSVGLGKTFTALAVIKYYENRNKNVLVLCPKKLADNWTTFKGNYVNNPIAEDRLRYDVLNHTDLSRREGESNGIILDTLNWGNYDLVVIDESHNFRNGSGTHANTHESRYNRLLDDVIRAGVSTKVLMLSATPVNNRFTDLKHQLELAYEKDPEKINDKLDISKTINAVFKEAQKTFTDWSKLKPADRTSEQLLRKLDFDFFKVLDSVTIARSRRHIERYYDTAEIGHFPKRLSPVSLRPGLSEGENISYKDISKALAALSLCVYVPSEYIQPSRRDKYAEAISERGHNMTRAGREKGIRRLMGINLLKRLESSVYAFRLTLERIERYINETINAVDKYQKGGSGQTVIQVKESDCGLDDEDSNTDLFVGRKFEIDLADMDLESWRTGLEEDSARLRELIKQVAPVKPERDNKLKELKRIIDAKIASPINEGNKKLLVFSAFADTAEYLYNEFSGYIKQRHGLNTALVTGAAEGKTTVGKLRPTLNNILTCFSPVSKEKQTLMPGSEDEIDVLFATDCISEGQNLQDCDYLVNYDIHWNPVRIIQRFGRIDRIGSKNEYIQLVNFWPDMELDEYIKLKQRVESRMKATVMTSTGDDNPIDPEEAGDLEYRREQLERLQHEVVDMEDMSTGVTITDLGLNEFRLDLLEYMQAHGDIDKKPKGLHAVVKSTQSCPPGVIFVLRNINQGVNIDNLNRIHPFYITYIDMEGNAFCDYLNPKKLLDITRLLCRGKSKPIKDLCREFNKETKDGRNMKTMSGLLSKAVESIIGVKKQSAIESLFRPGGTLALENEILGLDDFELICFLVVR